MPHGMTRLLPLAFCRLALEVAFSTNSQLIGWSAAETLGSCRAKTRGIKSRFKEYPKFAGGNKDGERSIQRLRNLISEMVFRDHPVYSGERERMSIMARSL